MYNLHHIWTQQSKSSLAMLSVRLIFETLLLLLYNYLVCVWLQ